MASANKNRKFAKSLLTMSLSEDGKVSMDIVTEILQSLKDTRPSGLTSILKLFLKEVIRHEYTYQAHVEIGCKNGEDFSESILKQLQTNSDTSIDVNVIENSSLIAGCKVRLGDDVYENSISDRLDKLEKTFL